jgi:hypothetical protein
MHPVLNVYLAESIRSKGQRQGERSSRPSRRKLVGRRSRQTR